MASILNIAGTSNPYFTIGKNGVSLFQGTGDPALTNTVNNGDYWFNSTSNSLNIRSSATWVAPKLNDLVFPTGTGISGQAIITDGFGNLSFATIGAGTVSSVSVVTANGFSGSIASSTTTPAITLSTTISGILKGDSTAISAASVGDFPTLNQNTTGSAATLTTSRSISVTGDATWSTGFNGSTDVSAALTLATVNVSPQTDTFRKLTINGKGLVTATSSVIQADIISSLGYTPVNKAGDTMLGNLILNDDPTLALGAATKQYVDSFVSGVVVHAACVTSTTSTLSSSTYDNGASGVGATLIANSNGLLGSVGGYGSLIVNDRVLIKDQVSTLQNGIYIVTDLGSVSTPWILTRASDFDNSPSVEVRAGDSTYIQDGTLNGTQWVMITTGTVIIGTTAIVFTQFAGAGTYTGGSGISIAGTTISNTGVLSNIAGTGIGVSGATGNITITNNGVTSLTGTVNQITLSGSTGSITASLPSSVTIGGTLTAGLFSGSGANLTGIPNSALTNNSLTIGSTNIALGATSLTLAGLTSVTATSFIGALTGNATTSTSTTNLTGGATGALPYQSSVDSTTFLAAGTTSQVLIGGTSAPAWTNTPTLTGTNFTGIPNSALTNNSVTVNGTSISLGASSTITAAAGTLTGSTLNSTVTSSSLTSVGTISTGLWNGTKVSEVYGGTNQNTYTTGDILFASGSNTLSKLGIGSDGQVLKIVSGLPSWGAAGGSSPLTTKGDVYTYSTVDARLPVGTNGQVLSSASAQTTGLQWITPVPAVDIQIFTSNGTWTKPTNAKIVEIYLLGGGGGGGSGAIEAVTTTSISGGGGGGGAGGTRLSISASYLSSSEAVVIGSPGTGGTGVTRNTSGITTGNAGTDGGTTTFSSFQATGGLGGQGGANNSTAAGGSPGYGVDNGSTGGSSTTSATGAAGTGPGGALTGALAHAFISAASGGAGGAATSGTTAQTGGNGGQIATQTSSTTLGTFLVSAGTVAAGTAGVTGTGTGTSSGAGNGVTYDWTLLRLGSNGGAGSGGACVTVSGTATSGTGGNGGTYGAGGGGSGAAQTLLGTATSSNGGTGGQGCAVIITYF
jgi:hypothetical protein